MNRKHSPVRFDDALPILVKYLRENMHIIPATAGVALRDGFGRLAFYLKDAISSKTLLTHQRALAALLGKVAFPAGAIQNPSAPGASILTDTSALTRWTRTNGETVEIKLVDRRFFGRDWLTIPSPPIAGVPPVLVFGSLKGGVGRTTALFILSMYLARRTKNILLIDLDLEAPGLAPLVFEGDERPRYGVLDYLVENGLGGVSDDDLLYFVGTSRLTEQREGGGRVDLAPATGISTTQHPENMLAKLARGLVEDPNPNGQPKTLALQIREFITRLSRRSIYDVILVDARAGLSELTAAPLLSLGGTVALFGTDQAHTFEGYKYLMAHLATLPVPDPAADWRERIRFVHAMAPAGARDRRTFDDHLYDVLSDTFYESDVGENVFNFSLNDEKAPHKSWRIFFDRQFLSANPIFDRTLIEEDVYQAAFGSFIKSVLTTLGLQAEMPE